MSTATTLKRVALVAVYALGFGLMSVAPSSAIVNNDTLTLSSATSTYKMGSAAASTTATITFIGGAAGDNVTTTAVLTSAPAGSAALPQWGGSASSISAATTYVTAAGGQQAGLYKTGSAGLATATAVVQLTPDVVGTYVVSISQSAGGVVTRSTTWTITASNPTVGRSSAYMTSLSGLAPVFADTGTFTSAFGVSATEVARIDVRQWETITTGSFETNTAQIADAYTEAVSVAITGAGLISKLDDGTGLATSATFAAGGSATSTVYVYPDARSGKATITITVGTTVIATKTYTFVGPVASIAVDTTTQLANIGVGGTDAIQFNASDAAGNLTGNSTLVHAMSSDTTIATVNTPVAGLVTVTGVKAGSTTIMVCNVACSSTATTAIKSSAITVNVLPVLSGNAFKVTMALDKATYAAGEKMTLTVSASDTSTPALAIADGDRVLFSTAPSANVNLLGTMATTTASLVSGKATYTLYAPSTSGNFTLSGVDATTAKNAVSVAFTVSNPAQEAADAATDAALEAIDAANAATDAANLAAEAADAATVAAEEARDAADAATAAVEALAAEVSTMISEIKAQLTALANVVAKIAKKVKA